MYNMSGVDGPLQKFKDVYTSLYLLTGSEISYGLAHISDTTETTNNTEIDIIKEEIRDYSPF